MPLKSAKPIAFEDLPELCQPLTEEIVTREPHSIVACDTGVRLVAYTVDLQLRDGGCADLAERMRYLTIGSTGNVSFGSMVNQARQTVDNLPDTDARVFVLDDAAYTGGSLTTARSVLTWAFPSLEGGGTFYNGVLVDTPTHRSQGAAVVHVSGLEVSSLEELELATSGWANDKSVLGVTRLPLSTEVMVAETPQSQAAREEIHAAMQLPSQPSSLASAAI